MIAKHLLLIIVCVAAADCRPRGEEVEFPKGRADNPTSQVSIVSPEDGAIIEGSAVPVRIETRDFTFAYERATTPGTMTSLPDQYAMVPQIPNEGHVHVYLASYPRGTELTPAKFYMVRSFLMPNATEFVLEDVSPGRYRLLVELVQHDHTQRIKAHPTDWPSFDFVVVTVR